MMKKVIFIGLLSLTVCLSRPEDSPASQQKKLEQPSVIPPAASNAPTVDAKVQTANAAEVAPAHAETQTNTANDAHTPSQPINQPTQVPANQNTPTNNQPTPPAANDNKQKPSTADENKTNPDKKPTEAPKEKETPTVEPHKDANTPTNEKGTPDKSNINNGTKPEDKQPVPQKTDPTKPTETPKDDKVLHARGFDGPSFIGGIILTLGLLAIGFMGFKYYKNQTERNYHTL